MIYARLAAVQQPLERIENALQRIGLLGFADHLVLQLSAGQKRRVALSRLLIEPASLWLLDEPFAALDAMTRERMQELLLNVWGASRAGVACPTAPVLPAAGAPLPQHRTLRESEDEAFLQALAAHQGSKAALAAKLGISERSLYRRLKALQPPTATP